MQGQPVPLSRRLLAEATGSFFLLATVVGSGIMADNLAGGNGALALLANAMATGAILIVLITMLGPISGAHFNPAVSMIFAARRDLTPGDAALYALTQAIAAITGVIAAHLMFGLDAVQVSLTERSGASQLFSEAVAAFGLVLTILLTLARKPDAVAVNVGLYIFAAYWFTASTSFANPAVTIARSLTATFAGIRPADVAGFIAAQLTGAALGWLVARALTTDRRIDPI